MIQSILKNRKAILFKKIIVRQQNRIAVCENKQNS